MRGAKEIEITPDAGPVEMAKMGVRDYIERDGDQQIKEAPGAWRPRVVGIWADAEEDASAGTPLENARILALRWLEKEDRRPYCATKTEWMWFDAATVIQDMGDGQSDLPTEVWKVLTATGQAGYKKYPSGMDALEGFVADLAAHVVATGGWPKPAK